MNLIKKILLIIFLNTFGIILALFLFEAFYRFAIKKEQITSWTDRPKFYYQPENSTNLQSNIYQVPKSDNVYRVAVIGDSFTFATSMQFDDAFPAKIERMLNLNDTSLKAEVINYGVPGYSTHHEVETVQKAIAEGADLVLLQITLNDPQLKNYIPTGITGQNEFGAFQPTPRQAKIFNRWQSLGYVVSRLHNTQTNKNYINYFKRLFSQGREFDEFKISLRKIGKACRNSKVKLVAVVFPLYGHRLDDSYPFFDIHSKVHNILNKNKIPYLDLFESYKYFPLSRIQVEPGIDFHPNEIGHRIAAEEIYSYLIKEEVLPTELEIKKIYKKRINILPKNNQPIIDK